MRFQIFIRCNSSPLYIYISWDTVLLTGESSNTMKTAANVTIFIDSVDTDLENPCLASLDFK